MRLRHWISIALFGLACLGGGSASAQATRTWVSGVGDDANPCSRTAPCKTFAGAISKTAAQGEIDVLDPGGFGTVTITKSISIVGIGPVASILASGTTGITVNAGATDRVVLRDIAIEGSGTGINGLSFLSGASVEIDTCVIHGFTGAAVSMQTSAKSQIVVRNSYFSDNAYGVRLTTSGTTSAVAVVGSTFYNNATANIAADGAGSRILLSNNNLAVGPILTTNSATVASYGNNVITNGSPTQTLPLQ